MHSLWKITKQEKLSTLEGSWAGKAVETGTSSKENKQAARSTR